MNAASLTRSSGWSICSRCLHRENTKAATRTLHRSSIHTRRKLHGTIVPEKTVRKNMIIHHQPSFHDYFSANISIDRGWLRNGLLAAWQTASAPKLVRSRNEVESSKMEIDSDRNITKAMTADLEAMKDAGEVSATPDAITHPSFEVQTSIIARRRRQRNSHRKSMSAGMEEQLPLDASSQLTAAASNMPMSAILRRRFATYLSLTKPRLSFLIILTTASAYSLYPIPEIISSATHAADASSTLSTSTLTLTFLTIGTFLSSASANTFNMLFEPKYDALMSRTRNRPLVRGLISTKAATTFAILCGAGGVLLLHLGTNPTVAGLSALNIFLYAGVYTPMKRISPVNTWVGAIVGGIPPLMGWAAAAGETATSEHHAWQDLLFSEGSVGGWLLAGLLFAWQFPHFNSLSHLIRDDYRNAGHKMLAWTNPARNARVALRYSFFMFPICGGMYWAGLVNPGFLVISTACNLWMTKEAVKFWKRQGAGGSARGLFWASVWQLPLVLVGALICKTGIWDGFFEKEPISIYEEPSHQDNSDGEGLLMETAPQSIQSTTLPWSRMGRPN